MSKIVQRCVERVCNSRSSLGHMCQSTAKHQHEGHWYCGTHYPPSAEARRAARSAAWAKKYQEGKAAIKAREQARAEQERRAACFDELLAALKAVQAFIEGKPDAVEPFGLVRAAIAKAGGNDE